MDVRPSVPRDSLGHRVDGIDERSTVETASPEQPIDMLPSAMARAMASRVQRERKRIAAHLTELLVAPDLKVALLEYIETLDSVTEVVASPVAAFRFTYANEAAVDRLVLHDVPDEIADTLPAVQHRDDFADGIAMVRNARGPLNRSANEG